MRAVAVVLCVVTNLRVPYCHYLFYFVIIDASAPPEVHTSMLTLLPLCCCCAPLPAVPRLPRAYPAGDRAARGLRRHADTMLAPVRRRNPLLQK